MLVFFLVFRNQLEARVFEGLCRIAAQQMLRTMIPRFPLARMSF